MTAGCTSTGIAPTKEVMDNISLENGETTYYVIREDAFGGAAATVAVHCNNSQYRLKAGEFVKCPTNEKVNYLSAYVGDGLFFTEVLENNENIPPTEFNKFYLDKNDGNKFIFLSTSLFSDAGFNINNLISQENALAIIQDGYDVVGQPSSTSSVLRNTAIMNPFTKWSPKFVSYDVELPTQMKIMDKKDLDRIRKKRGVIVFQNSGNLFSFGLWSDNGYHGSLFRSSFIFIESSKAEETIHTYYGGKYVNLTVPVNDDGITFVYADTSIGWAAHNRQFTISTEKFFDKFLPKLEYLSYDKNAVTEIPMELVEEEGLKLMKSLRN